MNTHSLRLAVCCLMLTLTACTGLGGEPQIVTTISPPTAGPTTPPDVGFPQSPPDLANGAQLYAQHCIACHGENGEGNGELVLSGQVPDPGNFRDPVSARSQFPRQWFNTITNGNLEKLMPPWKDALSERARWDVALYTYTLHYTPDQLALGEILFQDCAECHGVLGRGDGPESDPQIPAKDLTDQNDIVTLSDDTIYTLVVEGSPQAMPSYASQFNEEERWAVVAYARTLSLTNALPVISQDDTGSTAVTPTTSGATPPPAAVTPTTLAAKTMPVTGTVTNLTAGSAAPTGLTVTLRVFNAADLQPQDALTREAVVQPDATFRFEEVPVRQDQVYLTALTYLGRNFASGIFQGDTSGETLDLPIAVYELTDDPDAITIDAMITEIEVAGEVIQATYSVRFINTSDRLYTSLTAEPDGRYRSVYINLPPGAVVVGVLDEPRYIIAEDGSAVYETLPLQPGDERYMQVTYLLNYTDGAIIEYPVPFKVNGQVRVLIRPDTITLTGEGLPGPTAETLGGIAYQGYGSFRTLERQSILNYTLNGSAGLAAVAGETPTTSPLPFILIGAGVVLFAVGAGLYVQQRRARQPNKEQLIDGLIRQIAELDAQHNAGQINHDLYRHRREQLKARLAELMDQAKDA